MECEAPRYDLYKFWKGKREKTGRSNILRDILLIFQNGEEVPFIDSRNTILNRINNDKSIPRHRN